MLTRRLFCGCLAASTAFVATEASAQAVCEVFTPARQKGISPDEALTRLQEGHARFMEGKTINCDLRQQVKATSSGQAPFATVLGCIDSRVPPEMVFDQHIGDMFTARVAGNFIDDDILGSLEFATKVAGSKLLVVLGHTQCGAIKGALDNVKLGHLTGMLTRFEPALKAVTNIPGERSSHNHELVDAVCEANAMLTAASLTVRSPVLKALVDARELRIASAIHNLETGMVRFLA